MALYDRHGSADRLFLDGEWMTGGGGSREVVNPSDGETLGSTGIADTEDVDRAVQAGRAAQLAWAEAPFDDRAKVLRKAGQLLEENAAECADWLMREAGSARGKAGFEAGLVAAEAHFAAALALAPTGQILRTAKPRLSLAQRVPVGVVGVISPFNFPGVLSMRSVAPALALGNAVLLKPDPRTAIAGGLFLAAVLEQAGLPKGLLSVLPGGRDVGMALVEHPRYSCHLVHRLHPRRTQDRRDRRTAAEAGTLGAERQ